ncbi:hypothetical protein [Stenotrophomonas indicatrix]|uniref:hypothetical protein n=1 Tax=Stenotrophomonas indicatrix TaxID=2045451 RepID=UPI0010C4B6D2|nr:hypothetical protein [Stenotrophomonas indicatrix]QBR45087.1 hypothetical protein DAIF1_26610 [Stenotrophomonas indicatrix]
MQNGIGSRLRLAGVATVLMFAGQASALAAPAASPVTREAVAGISLSEWTARWWRWADAQRVAPYLDPDGRLCELGQEGPVWNLAGTNGRFQPRRQCVVPEGRHLLLPIINMASYQTGEDVSCEELQAGAAINNDHLVSAVVLLDGQPLGDMRLHRVKSEGCFRMDPDDDDSRLAAADGYWLMLKPLTPGRHTVSVGANYGAPEGGAYSQMRQIFEYVLHVGGRTQITFVTPMMVEASAP